MGVNVGEKILSDVRDVLAEAATQPGMQKVRKACKKWINKREGQVRDLPYKWRCLALLSFAGGFWGRCAGILYSSSSSTSSSSLIVLLL